MSRLAALCVFASLVSLAEPPARTLGKTMKSITFGTPVSLTPEESATGEGLTLRLVGYGHKLDMKRRDLPFIEVELSAGGEKTSRRFWREQAPEPVRWKGYEVRLTACEDHGPPHSATAPSTFVVVKATASADD